MSRLSIIRAAIVAKALSVPGMGQVHGYERFIKSEAAFRELYVYELPDTTKQLRGWNLRRTETQERFVAFGRSAEVHTWQVRGYMALSDENATEPAFDELIEAFRDAVRADSTFGGVCEPDPAGESGESPRLVEVLSTGPVNFCGVLCHSAVLQLRTWSYI